MHETTAAAAAEHTQAQAYEAELSAQWRRRATEAEAAESLMQAQVAEFVSETTAAQTAELAAGETAEHDATIWRERAEAAIAEAASAHSELAEFGAELMSLHSLHKQHKEEGERLRAEVSTNGAAARRGADTVLHLESELRLSEERNQLIAARAEQSAQLAFSLEMRAAEAEADELRRRTQSTAKARVRAQEITGSLSARRPSLSPSPQRRSPVRMPSPEKSYRGARQRAKQRATVTAATGAGAGAADRASPSRGRVKRQHSAGGGSPGLSSAAAVVSGTIGQHLGRHINSCDGMALPRPAGFGLELGNPGHASDSLASLLASPASYGSHGDYAQVVGGGGGSVRSTGTSAQSDHDHETTIGVLSMLNGLDM